MHRAAAILLLFFLFLPGCKRRGHAVTMPDRGAAAPDVSGRPCGDRAVLARFGECRDSRTVKRCLRNGGRWESAGGPTRRKACICPTGQQGCPCSARAQCAHACTAPLSGGGRSCDGITRGTCAGRSPLPGGCRCYLRSDGTAHALCVD